jgi:hypothetical protein
MEPNEEINDEEDEADEVDESEEDEESEEEEETSEPQERERRREAYLAEFQAQNQIEGYRQWLKRKRYQRAAEYDTLNIIQGTVTEGMRRMGKYSEGLDQKESSSLRSYLEIQRRKRDLIREERDDLKWLWELEHREFILQRRANRPETQEEPSEYQRGKRQYPTRQRANGKPKWNFQKPKKPKT